MHVAPLSSFDNGRLGMNECNQTFLWVNQHICNWKNSLKAFKEVLKFKTLLGIFNFFNLGDGDIFLSLESSHRKFL